MASWSEDSLRVAANALGCQAEEAQLENKKLKRQVRALRRALYDTMLFLDPEAPNYERLFARAERAYRLTKGDSSGNA